jgi:hypothetical protein
MCPCLARPGRTGQNDHENVASIPKSTTPLLRDIR